MLTKYSAIHEFVEVLLEQGGSSLSLLCIKFYIGFHPRFLEEFKYSVDRFDLHSQL